jgi:hypothetical protein
MAERNQSGREKLASNESLRMVQNAVVVEVQVRSATLLVVVFLYG